MGEPSAKHRCVNGENGIFCTAPRAKPPRAAFLHFSSSTQTGTRKWVPFSVVGRGGSPNHGALARGSAVRRRRQLSRSCCHLALEDEKREANLHPIYGRQSDVRFSVVGRGGFTNHGALARGSAVRRRRQLSRSCCHLAFEDEKPKTIISI